jgi:hypothetical protein
LYKHFLKFISLKADTGKHPTVNKLVEQFREEQHHTEALKAQLDAGDSYEKKGTREKDLKIRDVFLEYNSNDMPGHFEKLALVLSTE